MSMSLAQLTGNLSDAKWRLREDLDSTFVSLLGDGELQRVIPLQESSYYYDHKEWLDTYTAQANAVNATPQKYVTNIVVGTKIFTGIWRQAFVRLLEIGTKPHILQVLREGYIESLMTDDIIPVFDWSEARLDMQDSLSLHGSIEYLRVQFPNVSPEAVRAIVDEIYALDVDGFEPVIRGEPYGTDFYRQFVVDKIEQDGSATIVLQVSKSQVTKNAYTLIGTEDEEGVIHHWDVPESLVNTIMENHKWTDLPTNTVEKVGASATISYGSQTGLFDIVLRSPTADSLVSIEDVVTQSDCTFKTWTSYFWGLTQAQAVDVDRTIPDPVPATYSYTKTLQSMKAGKYMVIIKKRQSQAGTRDIVVTLREGVTETHKFAWGQEPATAVPVPASGNEMRPVALGRINDCAWYWHFVESDIDAWDNVLCFYYSDLTLNRRAWDTILNVYVDQYLYKRFKHWIKEFATPAEAFTWANSSWIARGKPYRSAGRGKHHGTQVTITIDQGWEDGDGVS